MTAAPARPARSPRPLTAAVLRLSEQPLATNGNGGVTATMDTQLRVLLDQQRKVDDLNDPEAVHQMRVAIRRMRVVLRADADTAPELRAELGWLGGELGTVRDLDVLAHRLATSASALGSADADGVAELLTALHDARVAARATLRGVLTDERYRSLLRALAKLVRATPATVDSPVAEQAEPMTDPLGPAGPAAAQAAQGGSRGGREPDRRGAARAAHQRQAFAVCRRAGVEPVRTARAQAAAQADQQRQGPAGSARRPPRHGHRRGLAARVRHRPARPCRAGRRAGCWNASWCCAPPTRRSGRWPGRSSTNAPASC